MSGTSKNTTVVIIGGLAIATAVVGTLGYFLLAGKKAKSEQKDDKKNTLKSSQKKGAITADATVDVVPAKETPKAEKYQTKTQEAPVGVMSQMKNDVKTEGEPKAEFLPIEEEIVQSDGWKLYTDDRLGFKVCSPYGIQAKKKFELFYTFKFSENNLNDFFDKSLATVSTLPIEVKETTPRTVFKIDGYEGLGVEYTFNYSQPKGVINFWTVAFVANKNIYTLQCSDKKEVENAKKIAKSLQFFEQKAAGSLSVKLKNGIKMRLPSAFYEINEESKDCIFDFTLKSGTRFIRGIKLREYKNIDNIDTLIEKQRKNYSSYSPAGEISLSNYQMKAKVLEYVDNDSYESLDVCFVYNGSSYIATVYTALDDTNKTQAVQDAKKCIAEMEITKDDSQEYLIYENTEYKFKINVPLTSLIVESASSDLLVTILMESTIDLETNVSCVSGEEVTSVDDIMNRDPPPDLTNYKKRKLKIGKLDAVQMTYDQQILQSEDISVKWISTAVVVGSKIFYIRSYTTKKDWNEQIEKQICEIHNTFQIV